MKTAVRCLAILVISHTGLLAQTSTHLRLDFAARLNGADPFYPLSQLSYTLQRSMDFGVGLSLLHKNGKYLAIRYGASIDRRSVNVTGNNDKTSALNVSYDYLDFPIALQFYPLFDGNERSVQPFLLTGVTPGIVVGEDPFYISSGFNFALNIGLGVELPISRSIAIEANVGYEHGLSDMYIDAWTYGGSALDHGGYLRRWNAFYSSATLLIRL